MTPRPELEKIATPIAIVIAGIIIGGSLYAALGNRTVSGNAAGQPQEQTGDLEQLNPVTATDHVRGNRDSAVQIVEYSDTECPFCKRFHETLKKVVASNTDVAWVYRHLPIDQLHPRARKEAIATECANELGGNDSFWKYIDRLFEITPANNGLDPAELPKIAKYVGLNETTFNECLNSTRYDQHIEDEVRNAAATGGNGTPWSIVVAKNGAKYPLSGAQPYEAVMQLVNVARADK